MTASLPSAEAPCPHQPQHATKQGAPSRLHPKLALFLPAVAAPLLSLVLLAPTLALLPAARNAFCPATSATRAVAASPSAARATVLTLTYGQPGEDANVAHNCRMLSDAGHALIVYTDRMNASFCARCACVRHVAAGCACPRSEAGACARRNPCEKLWFVADALARYGEMIVLDNDVVVLKAAFAARLWRRGRDHDFLASYGHAAMGGGLAFRRYRLNFNSGVMFMRRVAGVDYARLKRLMYELGSMSDQGVISEFVHRYYDNWDSLSLKWHCRMLTRLRFDIPLRECYTVHDKRDVEGVLQRLNMTRLTV